eukprot:CAMPEP_0203907532 /NCGR_PEP_ID=MMETSP0359-20131031/49015_1 /ASSEMBLY_ACC=CAM_ASM_000338 /TAXON_ID=268821 /ORGANISM="Scrippsiella Hangoei, Strain SHTV-5" /LENGTH=344 /DNA_ID=CAMNT_0050832359 /DNA_START=1 /DNA_END=1035 /DNA_ORIENTATION=+
MFRLLRPPVAAHSGTLMGIPLLFGLVLCHAAILTLADLKVEVAPSQGEQRLGQGFVEAASPRTDEHSVLSEIVQDALDPEGVRQLRDMLDRGQAVACCGHWQDAAAQRLQQHVAHALGLSLRHMGDVHLSNSSVKITSKTHGSSLWGAVVVLYLDAEEVVQATLTVPSPGAAPDRSIQVEVGRDAAVLVPEGAELEHSAPRRVAWLHVLREGVPQRSALEYYLVAFVRAHFVAPYDTPRQRKFFRTVTRHPRYWHGFMWSFLGMFLSIFAILPLVWRAIQFAEQFYPRCPESVKQSMLDTHTMPEHRLPTLLSSSARLGMNNLKRDLFCKGVGVNSSMPSDLIV